MKKTLVFAAFSLLLFSCKKEEEKTNDFSEATYKVTLTGLWTLPRFSVPASAHFTYFVGLVHNEKTSIWQEGTFASPGIEAVAENGNALALSLEIDSLIQKKAAIVQISVPPPPPDGSINRTFYCNSRYGSLSLVSMIAPSPDWFVGVSNVALYRNNTWLADTTINLYALDAGTEDGDVFGYNNPPTVPQQPIHLLTAFNATVLANGNAMLAPLVQLRLQKQ